MRTRDGRFDRLELVGPVETLAGPRMEYRGRHIRTGEVWTFFASPDEIDEEHHLQPGQRYGLGNSAGYPPATIVRDDDGKYRMERTSPEATTSREITAEDAAAWIASAEE